LNVLLQAATWIFAPLFISRWLASQLCPMDETAEVRSSLSSGSRVQARFLIRWLGVVISAMILTDYLRDMGDFSSGTQAVIVFVLVSIAGVGTFRLGGLLWRQSHRTHRPPQRSSKCPTGLWCVLGKGWLLLRQFRSPLRLLAIQIWPWPC